MRIVMMKDTTLDDQTVITSNADSSNRRKMAILLSKALLAKANLQVAIILALVFYKVISGARVTTLMVLYFGLSPSWRWAPLFLYPSSLSTLPVSAHLWLSMRRRL